MGGEEEGRRAILRREKKQKGDALEENESETSRSGNIEASNSHALARESTLMRI